MRKDEMKMKKKPKEESAESKPDVRQQIRHLMNPAIGDGLADQIIDLGLIPASSYNSGEFSIRLLNSLQVVERYIPPELRGSMSWFQAYVRPIVRERGDIPTIDVLGKQDRNHVEGIAKSTEEDLGLTEFVEKLKELDSDAAYRIDGKLHMSLKAWVAWTYYGSLKNPEADYSELNLPLSQFDIPYDLSPAIPTPNTYGALLWEYLDLSWGLIWPSDEMFKTRSKDLSQLNLLPRDWKAFYLGMDLEAYQKHVDQLIKRGAPKELFEEVLELYDGELSKDWSVKRKTLNLHFFMVAFLFKKDHPKAFRFYKNQVKAFLNTLIRGVRVSKKENQEQELEIRLTVRWFTKVLETDIFLASVFYSYLFDGEKVLEKKMARHRPSREVVGSIIVNIVDRLIEIPAFRPKVPPPTWRVFGAYHEIGQLLYALTGDRKLLRREQGAATPVKNLYHYWKPRLSNVTLKKHRSSEYSPIK